MRPPVIVDKYRSAAGSLWQPLLTTEQAADPRWREWARLAMRYGPRNVHWCADCRWPLLRSVKGQTHHPTCGPDPEENP